MKKFLKIIGVSVMVLTLSSCSSSSFKFTFGGEDEKETTTPEITIIQSEKSDIDKAEYFYVQTPDGRNVLCLTVEVWGSKGITGTVSCDWASANVEHDHDHGEETHDEVPTDSLQ